MRVQDLVSGAQSPGELFVNAVCDQAKHGPGLPFVLTYAPLAQINPFQRLLYCRAAQAGYAVVPAVRFDELGAVNWKGRSVYHLHWLASVLSGVKSNDDANARIKSFEQSMLRWQKNGHKIVWTMHNILPHNVAFEKAEITLREVIVEYADAIHVMSEESTERASKYYKVPNEKVFFVPHPSYENWYANAKDPTTARFDLGVGQKDFVFVQFGALHRYKGVLELIDAYKSLQAKYISKSFRLVIAGMPSDKLYLTEILDAISNLSTISLIQGAMQEKEIQTLFNAADIIVAPYVQTLNSGVALLAATFKKPLVAPAAAGVSHTYSEDMTLLYNGRSGNKLIDAMERSLSYSMSETVFTNILNKHKPDAISLRFCNELTERLFTTSRKDTLNGQ